MQSISDMLYSILKAVHIIFMTSYFAGIFYLVRLFVYYKDTDDFEETRKSILREQYVFMARRLWNIIIIPAGIIMLVSGLSLIVVNTGLLKSPWFHLKLLFLIGLMAYHYWSWKKVLQLKNLNGNNIPTANINLRQANEIATFLLFLVVFTVIMKGMVIDYWWQLLTGFFVLVAVITLTVKMVNRNKKSQ